MRNLLVILILTTLLGCGGGQTQTQDQTQTPKQTTQPKELFFRGNVVTHKSDHRQGVIVGKRYITIAESRGGPHDCWIYQVRFPCNTKDGNAYQLVNDIGEFELEPPVPPVPTPEKQQ